MKALLKGTAGVLRGHFMMEGIENSYGILM